MKELFKSNKGYGIGSLLIIVFVIVFIALPIISYVLEKYTIHNKAQILKNAIDITNVAVYDKLNANTMSQGEVSFDNAAALDLYKTILAYNLNLNSDLSPKTTSLASSTVSVKELITYVSGFPGVCPNGFTYNRATIHSIIIVPLRPSLYRQTILTFLGKTDVNIEIHLDSDIPINN